MAEQIELPFVLEFGLCSWGRSIHTEGVGAWEIPMRRHLAFFISRFYIDFNKRSKVSLHNEIPRGYRPF